MYVPTQSHQIKDKLKRTSCNSNYYKILNLNFVSCNAMVLNWYDTCMSSKQVKVDNVVKGTSLM